MSIKSDFKHYCGRDVVCHSHDPGHGTGRVQIWFFTRDDEGTIGKELHMVERDVMQGESRSYVARVLAKYAAEAANSG